jgi:hypothetical protein
MGRWLLLALLALSAPAWAAPPGSLVITAEPVDTSNTAFEKNLKEAAKHVLEKREDGSWTLYFIAFLKKPAGSHQVNLVFYDTAVKQHEPVQAFPIDTQASAKILASNVSFGGDQGFKAGHKYTVLITRLIAGKEDVYAKGAIALK